MNPQRFSLVSPFVHLWWWRRVMLHWWSELSLTGEMQAEPGPCSGPLWKVTGASSGTSSLRQAGQGFAEVTRLGASWDLSLVHDEGLLSQEGKASGGLLGDHTRARHSYPGPRGLSPLLRSSLASLSHINYPSHAYMRLLSEICPQLRAAQRKESTEEMGIQVKEQWGAGTPATPRKLQTCCRWGLGEMRGAEPGGGPWSPPPSAPSRARS